MFHSSRPAGKNKMFFLAFVSRKAGGAMDILGNLQVSKISSTVVFNCGCICELPYVGMFSEMKEWHVIACRNHTDNRKLIGNLAEAIHNKENLNRELLEVA